MSAPDVGEEKICRQLVERTVKELGKLDILVNNAAEQHPKDSIEEISSEQLERTFRTNIFAMFYLVKAAMKYLKEGAAIINTTSVTAYKGSPELLDLFVDEGRDRGFHAPLCLRAKRSRLSAATFR